MFLSHEPTIEQNFKKSTESVRICLIINTISWLRMMNYNNFLWVLEFMILLLITCVEGERNYNKPYIQNEWQLK